MMALALLKRRLPPEAQWEQVGPDPCGMIHYQRDGWTFVITVDDDEYYVTQWSNDAWQRHFTEGEPLEPKASLKVPATMDMIDTVVAFCINGGEPKKAQPRLHFTKADADTIIRALSEKLYEAVAEIERTGTLNAGQFAVVYPGSPVALLTVFHEQAFMLGHSLRVLLAQVMGGDIEDTEFRKYDVREMPDRDEPGRN